MTEIGAQAHEHIHAICDADFFDDLITDPEVEKAYERWLDGAFLRQGQAGFVRVRRHRVRGIPGPGRLGRLHRCCQAYFFPVGVPGLFRQYNARADFVETANTPAGGDPIQVRVIARRPDTIVGLGETRIHAETATFELRASKVANARPRDQLTVGGESFVVQGQPERRDPNRLVWTLDVRPA